MPAPAMPIDPAQATRLVKLLGMTGSDFDGEALAAVRKANELLQRAGLSWGDVIGCGVQPAGKAGGWREPDDWHQAVWMCLDSGAPLSDWDRDFLSNIASRAALTPRQKVQLDRIIETCRRYARHAA